MQELSKNQIKFYSSLKLKKHRDEEGLFIAEGEKLAEEIINSGKPIHSVIALDFWLYQNQNILKNKKFSIFKVSEETLSRISQLKTPNKVIIVLSQWNISGLPDSLPDISLLLDDIQDPGNLGTIIRIADWFGIKNIVCSENTVELFSPKVIQSTMGAFLRVKISYTDLAGFLKISQKEHKALNIYGAFLSGDNIYESGLQAPAFIVMGNESKGISSSIEKLIDKKITIPSYSNQPEKTESLNVAMATAIICAEFRRILH